MRSMVEGALCLRPLRLACARHLPRFAREDCTTTRDLSMRLIGLTGSIGMGKSATAAMFRDAGVPVFDADAAVHEIYRQPPTAAFREAFADAIVDEAIDRSKLAQMMVADPTRLPQLERIVHPLVGESRTAFLHDARTTNRPCVVLDIPLLMETKAEGAVDVVVVVSAPADMQRERTLARPGMTPEKFAMILGKQVPDVEKRRRAHFVIDTGFGFPYARRQVAALLGAIGC